MKVITDTKTPREKQARLSYLDNPAVVSLLDVIAKNIAEEFIEKVRGNRDVFENPPQPAPSPRGEKEIASHTLAMTSRVEIAAQRTQMRRANYEGGDIRKVFF